MSDVEFGSVWDLDVLWIVLLAAGIGALGGYARSLRPGDPQPKLFPSIVLGAIAAIAAFYVLAPTTPLKLIASCIIAGYAGPALLDSLETRFKLMVAEQKADRAIEIGEQAINLADETAAAARQARPPGDPPPAGEVATSVALTKASHLRSELALLKTGRIV